MFTESFCSSEKPKDEALTNNHSAMDRSCYIFSSHKIATGDRSNCSNRSRAFSNKRDASWQIRFPSASKSEQRRADNVDNVRHEDHGFQDQHNPCQRRSHHDQCRERGKVAQLFVDAQSIHRHSQRGAQKVQRDRQIIQDNDGLGIQSKGGWCSLE